MKLQPNTVIPVAVVLILIAGMILALAASRPDADTGADLASSETAMPPTPTAPPAPTRTATPPPPSATPGPRPTAVPVQATPPGSAAAEQIPELSRLRIVDISVLENPSGVPADFPPGMPLEFLVGIRRDRQPQVVEFFLAPPFPFAAMTGSGVIGPDFSEDGGKGKATGTGTFDGARATFTFEFQVDSNALRGTLTITNATTGATVLVLFWDGETF